MPALPTYDPGFRLVTGDSLNNIIAQVNNLTGFGTSGPITGTTLTVTSIRSSGASLAATGTVIANAAAIATTSVNVTGADGSKGVQLPVTLGGELFFVKNDDAANAILKVYPPLTGTINALGANNAISMASKSGAVFMSPLANTFYTIPLLPS